MFTSWFQLSSKKSAFYALYKLISYFIFKFFIKIKAQQLHHIILIDICKIL